MDLQGTPISGGGDGQKVTTDPRSNIPKQEGTGHVAPDSLAAESAAFQRANPDAEPPGTHGGPGTQIPSGYTAPAGIGNTTSIIGKTEVQPLRSEGGSGGIGGGSIGGGSGSDNTGPGGIGNTTGVIGKTELAPLTSATGGIRSEGASGSGGSGPGPGGIGNTAGMIGKTELAPLTSATGGIGHISGSGQTVPDVGPGGSMFGASEGRGGEPGQGEAAPSYITNVVAAPEGMPKGRNLQEGGFEGEANSTLPDPGTRNDPARRAVHDIEERNAISAGGTGPRDPAISGNERYEALDPTRHAPHSGT